VVRRPVAQVDLVPTILRLKGLDAPASVDGRVLCEALREEDEMSTDETPAATLTAETADGRYRASVQVSSAGRSRYLDHGRRIS
jgi:arylsulfatase A-like enzyme